MEKSQKQSQSNEIEKYKGEIMEIVRGDLERRNKPYSFFRNTTLLTYTDTGRMQYIGYREKPDWKEDYQYNVFDPVTRDKIMAIRSKIRGLFEAQFFNTNKKFAPFAETIAHVLMAFYKDASRRLKDKNKNKLITLAALTTPKAIWYEGWRIKKRDIKEIEERDEKTGEITKTSKKSITYSNDPYGELIPVEDFIPGSMKIRDIQEQPRMSWITRMQEDQFRREFSENIYPEAKKVKTSGQLLAEDYTKFSLRDDLKENEIEVLRYFNKWNDELAIIANGILITKLGNSFPFIHKDFPFCWTGFEELNPHFIYDMPLTIKLMDMQDADNEVLNLSLDMLWRALNEIVLVSGGDEISDDILYGGGFVEVDNPQNFQKLQFGSNFALNAGNSMMERIRRSLESSSVDAIQQGQTGQGRDITAREVLAAREAAIEMTSFFLENLEELERDKAVLRVKNMLDRYTRPVQWEKRIGEKLAGKAIPMFRQISVRNSQLDKGRVGLININITPTPRLEDEIEKENLNFKEMSQTIDISPDFIREIEFDVEIVANSSVKRSKALEVAQAKEFFGDALKVPQIINVRKAAENYIKALDKSPDEELMPEQGGQGDMTGAFNELGASQNKPARVPELLMK